MDPFASPVDPMMQPPAPPIDPALADPLAGLSPSGGGPPPNLAPTVAPIGPPVPPGWKVRPKPEWSEVVELAEDLKSERQQWLRQIDECNRRLAGEVQSVFQRDQQDYQDGEVEGFQRTMLIDQHHMACSQISAMNTVVKPIQFAWIEEDEAALKMDAVRYVMDCESRDFARRWGRDVKRTMLDLFQRTAFMVSYEGVNPLNRETGLDTQLLNPMTCFPVWEGADLGKMVRCYQTSAADFVKTFDVNGDVEKALNKMEQKTNGKRAKYDPRADGDVVECWDDQWFVIGWNNDLIVARNHPYRRVPFVVMGGDWGEPPMTSSYSVTAYTTRRDTPSGNRAGRSRDFARQYPPFLQRFWRANDIAEAVGTRELTLYQRGINPAMVWTMGPNSDADESPQVEYRQQGLTRLGPEETLDPLQNLPDPGNRSGLYALLQQNDATGVPPAVLNGGAPMSQASGTAIDILTESGAQSWHPLVRGPQTFYELRAERWLENIQYFGAVLGSNPADLGYIALPQPPGKGFSPVRKLTPELIQRSGSRVQIEYRRRSMGSLAARAQALSMLSSVNGGVISDYLALDIADITDDVPGELERSRMDMLRKQPDLLPTDMLEMILGQIEDAKARGDMDSLTKLIAYAQKVASDMDKAARVKQMEAMQMDMQMGAIGQAQQMQQSGMLGPDGNPVEGATPDGPGIRMNAGTDGGRPQGAMGPPPPAGPPPPTGPVR